MESNTSYQKVARVHENLNVELNHSSLSRLFMNDIAIVSPQSQCRAIEHLLYLLELNHRSWEQLTEYYSASDELRIFSWSNLLKKI